MPDCFISYVAPDEQFAAYVHQYLQWRGLSVFMAALSLGPGEDWSAEILNALRSSPWVIFLASRRACSSPYVQQEVGGAVFGGRKLVPVVWDMAPPELPGWAAHFQALDLRGLTAVEVPGQVERIASAIHADKLKGALIAAGIIAGFLLLVASAGDGRT